LPEYFNIDVTNIFDEDVEFSIKLSDIIPKNSNKTQDDTTSKKKKKKKSEN